MNYNYCKLGYFTDHAKRNLELMYIRTAVEDRDTITVLIEKALNVAQAKGFLLVHSEHLEQALNYLNAGEIDNALQA